MIGDKIKANAGYPVSNPKTVSTVLLTLTLIAIYILTVLLA